MVKKKENKKLQVEALGDRVLVQRKDAETVTQGGIILAEGSQEEPIEGTVFGIGPDCVSIKVGDIVLMPAFAGNQVTLRGNQFSVLAEEEIMLRIHE